MQAYPMVRTNTVCFNFQGFYVALRLVACAQSGQEVSLSSLNLTVPPPKFVSLTLLLTLKSTLYLYKNRL